MQVDGDSALLAFLMAVGLIPVLGDLTQGRRVGGLSTVGLLVASWAAVSLWRRSLLLFRARALRRQLLAQERWLR